MEDRRAVREAKSIAGGCGSSAFGCSKSCPSGPALLSLKAH